MYEKINEKPQKNARLKPNQIELCDAFCWFYNHKTVYILTQDGYIKNERWEINCQKKKQHINLKLFDSFIYCIFCFRFCFPKKSTRSILHFSAKPVRE